MTKYLDPSFSVNPGASKDYRDNWQRIFGKCDLCKKPNLEIEQQETLCKEEACPNKVIVEQDE